MENNQGIVNNEFGLSRNKGEVQMINNEPHDKLGKMT
jgi:hypothetical protein